MSNKGLKLIFDNPFSSLILLSGLFVFLSTILGVYLNYSPVPIGDEWHAYFSFYLDSLTNWKKAFWDQHNEHRVIFDKLIYWADMRWFGGMSILGLIANIILGIGTCYLLFIAATRNKKTMREKISILGFSLIVCFSWAQAECFNRPILWDGVFLFSIASLIMFQYSLEKSGSRSWNFFNLSIIFAIIAVCCRANALLLFPLLIAMAFYFRLDYKRKIILLSCTVIVWWLYFFDYISPDYHGDLVNNLKHYPKEMIRYSLVFLGSPFFHTVSTNCYLLGKFFALIGLMCIAIFLISPQKKNIIFPSLILLIMGSIFLAAGGRANFGAEQALSQRYKFIALLYWFSAFMFLYESFAYVVIRKLIFVISCSLAILLLIIMQKDAFFPDHNLIFMRNLGGLVLSEEVYDEKYGPYLYVPKQLVNITDLVKQAKALNLSIFKKKENDHDVPKTFLTTTNDCKGQIEEILPTSTPHVYAIKGWILNKNLVHHSLIITDAQGHKIGKIITGQKRIDVADALSIKNKFTGWMGFYKGEPLTIQIFGKMPHGEYCRFSNNFHISYDNKNKKVFLLTTLAQKR